MTDHKLNERDRAELSTMLTDLQIEIALLHRNLARGEAVPLQGLSFMRDGQMATTSIQLAWRTSLGELVNVSLSKRGYYVC